MSKYIVIFSDSRESQREPDIARESQREPERARESQIEPDRARESQIEPERVRESQREPGSFFGSLAFCEACFLVSRGGGGGGTVATTSTTRIPMCENSNIPASRSHTTSSHIL